MFGTNRLGTYTLDLDQWDALNGGTNGNPSDFSASDIVDVKSLAGRLQAPSKGDAVSQYLTNELSAETRSLLTNYETGVGGMMRQIKNFFGRAQPTNGVSDDAMLRQALAGEFNRIIKTKTIYDAQRFKHVKLTPVTVGLIGRNPQGAELARLNRKLLLQAYPEELLKRLTVVQFEPRNDGTNLVLGLRVDDSADAQKLANLMHVDLNTLSPAGGFFVAVQVAFYGGLALASPFIFYFIAQFVFPAMKMKERHYVYRGLAFSVPLFALGVCFCYFVLMPVALAASQIYSNWLGFSANIWRAEDYISFVCKFMLGMGLGFQMPVVLLVLVKMRILSYSTLSKARRYMIVINLILGALLTTPEVITQVLMVIPLQLLYEISVWIAWYWERQEKRRAAAADDEAPDTE